SVDAEVLYPYHHLWDAIKGIKDATLRGACYRAYNDWIAEFCSTNPQRLIGLGKIPNTAIADAIPELKRCVEVLTLRGVILELWHNGGTALKADEDDQFWRVAEQLKVPVSIHLGLGNVSTAPSETVWVSTQSPVTTPLVDLVKGEVYDRFPGLRIVAA